MALELVDSHGKQIEPVLLTHFGDGTTPLTNRDVALDLKVLTDLAKATLPNNMSQASSLQVAAALYGYNDSGNVAPIRAWSAGDDGNSNTYAGLATYNRNIKFNGSTWDRVRNNQEATLLASANRTADAQSADQTNYNARGVVVTLNITGFNGDDTLTLVVQGKDPVSGVYYNLLSSAAISTAGMRVYIVHPGVVLPVSSTDIAGISSVPLPRTWRVYGVYGQVGGVADYIAYSVGACLIN